MIDQLTASRLPQPLLIHIESIKNELMQTIAAVDEQKFNLSPFEGSWTAGQLIEHIRLSVSGTLSVMNAPVTTTNRSPDKYAEALKEMFLDFNAKYTSAAMLIPPDKHYDKNISITGLMPVIDTLKENIQTQELTDTCLAVDFPGMGNLTRLEWATLANIILSGTSAS